MERPSKAIVDLQAIQSNFYEIKKTIAAKTKIMAVIKANAYGHGACEVARVLLQSGADMLAVATVEEGIDLRRNNMNCDIVLLSAILPCQAEEVVRYRLQTLVFSEDIVIALNQAAQRQHRCAQVHIKLDTGMHRLGVADKQSLTDLLDCIKKCNYIQVVGACTHFACADDKDKTFSQIQVSRFETFIDQIKSAGFGKILLHASNSAAICHRGCQYDFDVVRAGISLYGYFGGQRNENLSLKPAMTLRTRIVQIKEIDAGEGVSYGLDYIAKEKTRVAVLPIGYADGYNRIYAKNGRVIVHDHYADIIGRICMDACMIDITHLPEVALYDEVILMGQSENCTIWADELAQRAGTISYEVLTNVSSRIKRNYV